MVDQWAGVAAQVGRYRVDVAALTLGGAWSEGDGVGDAGADVDGRAHLVAQ